MIGPTNFTVTQAGTYHVTFVGLTAALSLGGGFQIFVNGAAVGPAPGPISGGANVVLDELIALFAGDVVEVRSTGLAVTLAAGANATFTIEQIA